MLKRKINCEEITSIINLPQPKQGYYKVNSYRSEILEKLKGSANFKPQPGKSEKSFFERIKEYFE